MRAGLSQDVARTRINRYERGVHDCDSATASRLASALGVPVAALHAESDLVAEAIKLITSLPSEDQISELERLRKAVMNRRAP